MLPSGENRYSATYSGCGDGTCIEEAGTSSLFELATHVLLHTRIRSRSDTPSRRWKSHIVHRRKAKNGSTPQLTRSYSMEPVYVYSLNPQYPYGEKSEDDHVQVVGKVIGTVSADEIPDAEDAAILKDLKSDELYEFNREYDVPL